MPYSLTYRQLLSLLVAEPAILAVSKISDVKFATVVLTDTR